MRPRVCLLLALIWASFARDAIVSAFYPASWGQERRLGRTAAPSR